MTVLTAVLYAAAQRGASCRRGCYESRTAVAVYWCRMEFKLADLYDAHADAVWVAHPSFGNFGGVKAFGGRISTVRCFEDNSLVAAALAEPGAAKVLVVDGVGSDRCALLGDRLAGAAVANAWAGIIVYGCIRDSAAIMHMQIGLKAVATCPVKSKKNQGGERDVPVRFAGVIFAPGEYVYADMDGIIVSARNLVQNRAETE